MTRFTTIAVDATVTSEQGIDSSFTVAEVEDEEDEGFEEEEE